MCEHSFAGVLKLCYRGWYWGIIKVLQRCKQGCYRFVTGVLYGYRGVTEVVQGWNKSVTRIFKC